jgi:hypothetical protein
VAMKEGTHEGPTQGYPQEITDALNSTVTSVDDSASTSFPDLGLYATAGGASSGDSPAADGSSMSMARGSKHPRAGLDTTVNAGRLGSLLVDVSDRGMNLEPASNSTQRSSGRIFASPASTFGAGATQQQQQQQQQKQKQKQQRSGGGQQQGSVFSAHSMPDLLSTSSASILMDRTCSRHIKQGDGSQRFAGGHGSSLCRPAPALLRGRPVALRMVPGSLQRERYRKEPTRRPYEFVAGAGAHQAPLPKRLGDRKVAHWSEQTADPSNVSVSYV